jgi:hypothetical protein
MSKTRGSLRESIGPVHRPVRSARSVPPPYQTRTCARCGRHTTFVLDDPAGGWYVCVECGRYA